MNDGHSNAETGGTGHTPGDLSTRWMPIATRCVTNVGGSVDESRVDMTAGSSWWSGASSEPVGMFGGALSERSMACLTTIDLADRIASGHPGFRLVGKCARCGRGGIQEMDVGRGSDMQPGQWTCGSTCRPQATASVNDQERQHESWFSDGKIFARAATSGRPPIGRGEGEWSRQGSVGKTCDGKDRYGIELRSGKRGDREMGHGMTQLMTDRGARRERAGKYQYMTHGVILREADIAAYRTSFREPPLGSSRKPMVSGREAVNADCHRWRRQIGRRGSGEDPDAATPWWAGRWCEASP
jgi:hypothetical protein